MAEKLAQLFTQSQMSMHLHAVVGNGFQRAHPQFRDNFPSRSWRIQQTLHFISMFFFDVTFGTVSDKFDWI